MVVRKRFFLVGCSRSGTTMLQVQLSKHPIVNTFPESNFFLSSTGDKRKILSQLGFTTGLERQAILNFLQLVEKEDIGERIPKFMPFYGDWVDLFTKILDEITLEEGCLYWLEKTPLHVHRIYYINKYVPDTTFIHIVRDGKDVVASIVDRATKYPDRFGFQENYEFGIERWNKAISKSYQYIGRDNHLFVSYEKILQGGQSYINQIYKKLELPFEEDYSLNTETVVPDVHPWIHKARKNIDSNKSNKFEEIFNKQEKTIIENKLHYEKYNKIIEEII